MTFGKDTTNVLSQIFTHPEWEEEQIQRLPGDFLMGQYELQQCLFIVYGLIPESCTKLIANEHIVL